MTDTKDDRDRILRSIEAALDGGQHHAMRRRPPGMRPKETADASSLANRLEETGCIVEKIGDASGLPGRVSELMKKHRLGKRLAVCDKNLLELNWQQSGLKATCDWDEKLKVAVTRCAGAIVETGQLLVTNESEDARLSLLADTHVVLVDESQIHAALDDLSSMLGPTPPGVATFIAGPSRTADIEQTLVMGAHGPRRVVAFILATKPSVN